MGRCFRGPKPNIEEFIYESFINIPTEDKTSFEIYKLFLTEEIILKWQ